MSKSDALDAYGTLIEPATLRIQRLLPGTVDRVWAYLTEGELRRQWLAAGRMEMKVGSTFELVWRNHELTDPPGKRPPGFAEEHRMQSRIVALDPPRRLTMTWQGGGDVTFELEPRGSKVLLTVTHRRLTDRAVLMKVGPGWHTHLDVLAARLAGNEPEAFWDTWSRLQKDYEKRLPA